MFIRKQVAVFLILQNIVSTFCDPVPLDVFSGDSEYIGNNKLLNSLKDYDDALEKNILIAEPVSSTKKYVYESVEGNTYEQGYDSTEYSENSVEENFENYTSEHSENNSNNNSENNSDDNSENNSDNNSESNSDNNSENNSDNNSENNSDNNSENNSENKSDNNSENNSDNNSENNSDNDIHKKTKDFCPGEDYSVISHSDIKYLIEDKAETLKIKEKVLNSYYSDADEVFKKHMGELEEFQKRFKERPGHMLHVLRSMTNLREQLEPAVEDLAAQLDQFETLEDNFNGAAKGAVVILNQLEKYKKICHINCDEIQFRFGHEINSDTSIVEKPNGMYCIRLKHLNDYINEKLSEIEAQYDDGLSQPLDIRDKMYEQKILELKSNLKDAAVKQFGMTMYDLLSLHDDYHHFRTDLEHVNVSSEIYNIMENNAEIGFKLIGLKRDLEKYREHCMKCGNARIKRHVFEEDEESPAIDPEEPPAFYPDESSANDPEEPPAFYPDESSAIDLEEPPAFYPDESSAFDPDGPPAGPIEEFIETDSLSVDAAIDELIQSKVDEIKKNIESNFLTMFAGLDEKLNDPDVIDHYVSDLYPIQIVIENEIKKEQEALLRLRNRIPEASINKILVLSKESKQIVQNLESAKQFIDDAIKS